MHMKIFQDQKSDNVLPQKITFQTLVHVLETQERTKQVRNRERKHAQYD